MENKQIDKMAKDFCAVGIPCEECHLYKNRCHAKKYAERAYKAGYRKAPDVAMEIFEEIEKTTASVYNDFMFNRDGVGMRAHYVVEFADELDLAIAELKKKYTKEA